MISQTLAQVNFGAAAYTNTFGPGGLTNYYSILPGVTNFVAERQDGTQTANMLFNVGANHYYTVTLSDHYEASIVLSIARLLRLPPG